MGVRMYGPLATPPAVGADGSATATVTSNVYLDGELLAVMVKYVGASPATTDIKLETAGLHMPAQTLLKLDDANTDGMFLVRSTVVDSEGYSPEYNTGFPVVDRIPFSDRLKLTIEQANVGNSVEVWLMYS